MTYAVRESFDRAVLGAWWIGAEKVRVPNVLGGDSSDEDAEREEESSRTHPSRCEER